MRAFIVYAIVGQLSETGDRLFPYQGDLRVHNHGSLKESE
jgi:hypothetical protein